MKLWTALCRALCAEAETNADLKEQVCKTEIAFAKAMAERDASAFTKFLSKEVVFMSGGKSLRGPQQVSDGWNGFFTVPAAPFSRAPEFVEVPESGTVTMPSGPVREPAGKPVGTFNSVWRREPGGNRKIVIDNGCPACNCAARAK